MFILDAAVVTQQKLSLAKLVLDCSLVCYVRCGSAFASKCKFRAGYLSHILRNTYDAALEYDLLVSRNARFSLRSDTKTRRIAVTVVM